MLRIAFNRYLAAYAGLPREVRMMATAIFVNRCGTMVLPFLALYLTSRLSMSEVSAGRIISTHGLGAICSAYLGGRLTEPVGAIRLQTFCLFLCVPCILVLPLFNH